MIPKKIYAERPDIKEKVEREYPEPKEKPCPEKMAKLNRLRFWMAKKLYYESTNIQG